jgi:hypothetical protein
MMHLRDGRESGRRETGSTVWLSIAALVLIPLLFYAAMVFGGREPAAPDTLSVRPLGEWARSAERSMGETPQWLPYLFSGMPSYGSYIYTPASRLSPLDWILRPFANQRGVRYFLFFVLGGVSAFAFFRRQGVSAPAAAAAALGFVLTPYIPGAIEAGHSTKLRALMHVPLVLLAVDLFLDRPGAMRAAGVALAAAMLGWSNHPQITYYAGMIVVLYVGGRLLAERSSWTAPSLLRAAAWFLAAAAVALLLIAEPTLAVKEYAPFSIRGAGEGGGVGWQYATAWSFPPRESISFLFPDFYGLKGATYFGALPFTQSTHYFGIALLAVAVLGFLSRRSPRSWIWLMISLLVLIVGLGEYFPLLYKPFFVLLPYFNKFRIPSMIYALLPLSLGFLAATGLDRLAGAGDASPRRGRQQSSQSRWFLPAGIALAIALLALVVGLTGRAAGPSGAAWVRADEVRRLSPGDLDLLRSMRWSMRIESIVRSMILLAALLAAVPIARRLRPPAGAALLGAILVADICIVGAKFLDFVPKADVDAVVQTTPQIDFLKRQEGLFRVLPVEEFSSNRFVAFDIGTVGGYQPAKLRIYQDLIERNLLMNPPVLSMLNVRYLLSSRDPGIPEFKPVTEGIYEFTRAQPRAWFVPSWRELPDEESVLRAIGGSGFSPGTIAFFSPGKTPALAREGLAVRSARVEAVNPHLLRIDVEDASSPGLLVVSEIYYPAGWTAIMDGRAAPILRANHCLRALEVPAGPHRIEMRYSSKGFRTGRTMSRIGGLGLLGLAAAGFLQRRRSSSPR